MKKAPLLLVLLTFFVFLSSCKKDDDSAPATKADILGGRTWVLTEHTVSPGRQDQQGNIVTDLYRYFGSTYQDNIIRFNRNPNTYTFEEGPTKGDPTVDQVSDAGTWLLNSDETTLVLQSANGQVFSFGQVFSTEDEQVFIVSEGETTHLTNLTIKELTPTTLTYTYSYRLEQGGQIYTETLTYTVD